MEVKWLEQSVADLPNHDTWLSAAERRRCDGFRIPKRRADWRLGRWTAKRAVAAYLVEPCDPALLARIEIRSAASGAPEVFLDNQPAQVSISITHRAGIAACAVAPPDWAIGCDLELIEPRSDAFLADYFTAAEHALIKRVSADEQIVTATLIWSAKESALKALQVGLRLDTRSVEVSLGESSPTTTKDVLKSTVHAPFGDAAPHLGNWRPLSVSHSNRESFFGWWSLAGQLVRTIVTDPGSNAPTVL